MTSEIKAPATGAPQAEYFRYGMPDPTETPDLGEDTCEFSEDEELEDYGSGEFDVAQPVSILAGHDGKEWNEADWEARAAVAKEAYERGLTQINKALQYDALKRAAAYTPRDAYLAAVHKPECELTHTCAMPGCGKSFAVKNQTTRLRFCQPKCKQAYRSQFGPTPMPKECVECGKTIDLSYNAFRCSDCSSSKKSQAIRRAKATAATAAKAEVETE